MAPGTTGISAAGVLGNFPAPPSVHADEELAAYREMLLIRRFEEKAGQLYGMGFIGGFCHLYIGQEAVVVGMQMAIEAGRSGDHHLSRPRPHARHRHGPQGRHGRVDGPRRRATPAARAARCTCSPRRRSFYGGHGIVGANVPLGAGLAFANKYRGNDNVCLTYFGDGAANQGQVYETFNMAKLWHLPVIFIIENNRYAMGTAIERSRRRRISPTAAPRSTFPASRSTAWTCAPCSAAGERVVERSARGQGPLHPGDADLSLPRPLDVGPREVPHPRGGRQGARAARPDRARAQPPARSRHGKRGRAQGDRR